MIKLIHPKWVTEKPPTPPYSPSLQWYLCIHFLCCNPQPNSEEPQSSELIFFLLLSSWQWWWGAAGCSPSCSWRSSLDLAMFEEHQALTGNRKERPSWEQYGTWGNGACLFNINTSLNSQKVWEENFIKSRGLKNIQSLCSMSPITDSTLWECLSLMLWRNSIIIIPGTHDEVKGEQKKHHWSNFVFLISWVPVIGSSKCWCLPPIIPH